MPGPSERYSSRWGGGTGDPWPIIGRASRSSHVSAERAQVGPNLRIIGTTFELLAQPENGEATLQRVANRAVTGELAVSFDRVTRDLLTAARARDLVDRNGRMVGLAFMPNALGNNRLGESHVPDLLMFNHLEMIDQAVDVLRRLDVSVPIWQVALPRHAAGHAAHTIAEEIAHLRERDHETAFRQLLVRLIDLAIEIGVDRRLEADFRRILHAEALAELAQDYTELHEEVERHGPDVKGEQEGLERRSVPAGRGGSGARERDARERPRDVVRDRARPEEPGRGRGDAVPSGPSTVPGRADAGRARAAGRRPNRRVGAIQSLQPKIATPSSTTPSSPRSPALSRASGSMTCRALSGWWPARARQTRMRASSSSACAHQG